MSKNLNLPRKLPKQARSRTLVDRILSAASAFLIDDSNSNQEFSTNKVADKAGISIGSLYQYFPNKDSIISDLIERKLDEDYKEIEKIIHTMKGESIQQKIRVVVQFVLDKHWEYRNFFRKVMEHLPRFQKIETILRNREKARNIIQSLLDEDPTTQEVLQLRDTKLVSFVIVQAVMGVIESCLFNPYFNSSKEELLEELVGLIQTYITHKK